MLFRTLVLSACIAGACLAQAPFPMTYLGDLSGVRDTRTEAGLDLGNARVFETEDGLLLIQGSDRAGAPWKVWLDRNAMYGQPAYRGDFDADGQPDLLILNPFFSNGACWDGGTFLFLMMDEAGRPVPWEASSHGFGLEPDGRSPVLLDTDGDGRAELAISECEGIYEEQRGEHRSIQSVFEAGVKEWIYFEPVSQEPFLAALRPRYERFKSTRWLEGKPSVPTASPNPQPAVETRVVGILSDGRYGEQVRYADGKTRNGWPVVVEDAPTGRQIHVAEPRWALDRLLQGGNSVRIVGSDESPRYLWTELALEDSEKPPAPRVLIESLRTAPIQVQSGVPEPEPAHGETIPMLSTDGGPGAFVYSGVPAGGGDPGQASAATPAVSVGLALRPFGAPIERQARPNRPYGWYFSRGGRCFLLPGKWDEAPLVHALDDCSLLGDLQSDAERGVRIDERDRDGAHRVDPRERSYATMLFGQVHRFERPPAIPGDLVGAGEFGEGFLAQWGFGGQMYFMLHDREGSPLGAPAEAGFEGELLRVGYNELIFLRWEDDLPVEVIHARATIEWVRTTQ